MARIGVDLDGVLYDFTGAAREWVVSRTGRRRDTLPVPDRWNTWEVWGMDAEEWASLVHAGVDAGFIFAAGPIEPMGVASLLRLRDAGHSIHIVTARSTLGSPGAAERNTRDWLRRNHVPFDTLTFSQDKTCVPTDVFIEDNLSNYDALAAAGTIAVLRDQPWNTDDGSRRRIVHLAEFPSFVTRALGGGAALLEAPIVPLPEGLAAILAQAPEPPDAETAPVVPEPGPAPTVAPLASEPGDTRTPGAAPSRRGSSKRPAKGDRRPVQAGRAPGRGRVGAAAGRASDGPA